MEQLRKVRDAIHQMHGCVAVYRVTVPVEESFNGQVVWSGEVLVFDLVGHPKAKVCYAWAHADGKGDTETRYVAVLHVPPIDSPRKAVQAAIVSQFKSGR